MLRWTKDSSAAHGVLAIFVLLLSASQGIPIVEDQEAEVRAEQPIETTAVTTSIPDSTDEQDYPIKDFAWKSDLESPCPPTLPGTSFSHRAERNEQRRRGMFQAIKRGISTEYLNATQDILRHDLGLIRNCVGLPIDPVSSNPSSREIQAMNATEALKAMYGSILRSTAYASFVHEQLQIYANNTDCLNGTVRTESRSKWSGLKNKMKFLACTFLELVPDDADPTNYFDDVTQSVLDETLSDQKICSRRLSRNCQMAKSINHTLTVVNSYASSQASSGR